MVVNHVMTRIPYPVWLLLAFTAWWIAMAIEPIDRADWALENVLSVATLLLLIGTYRRFPFSRVSYSMLFLFGVLHTVGSHYTYSLVPYDEWFRSLTGSTLNELMAWERNHYDRLVHFLYGLLLAYPIREVFLRIADVRGFWGYLLPLDFAMSTSMIFELIEWAVAILFGGDLGTAYLGTQGDVWDAHKDMLLASIGALIAMGITLAINASLQRDFNREWIESLRVKRSEPLGEIEVARMLEER